MVVPVNIEVIALRTAVEMSVLYVPGWGVKSWGLKLAMLRLSRRISGHDIHDN